MNEQTESPVPKIHVLIDGSYFCFHRYYSIVRWWKNSHKEEADAKVLENPYENKEFTDTFFSTFKTTVKTIEKHIEKIIKKSSSDPSGPEGAIAMPKPMPMPKEKKTKNKTHPTPFQMYVAKDCKRTDIWRNALYDGYKEGRKKTAGIGDFIKHIYTNDLFIDAEPTMKTLYHPSLEADDCIALFIMKHRPLKPQDRYFILSGDKDYLQLTDDRTTLLDLNFEDMSKKKSSTGCAAKDLFCKIVMGDPSDNITSVLKKCGHKTAIKCFDDPVYFKARLDKEGAHDLYLRNQKLIMFDYIPADLQAEFYAQNESSILSSNLA